LPAKLQVFEKAKTAERKLGSVIKIKIASGYNFFLWEPTS